MEPNRKIDEHVSPSRCFSYGFFLSFILFVFRSFSAHFLAKFFFWFLLFSDFCFNLLVLAFSHKKNTHKTRTVILNHDSDNGLLIDFFVCSF